MRRVALSPIPAVAAGSLARSAQLRAEAWQNAHCSRMLTFSTIKFMPSMLSPVLIGRDAELRALVVALDAAATGAGSALFLTGDPGVGKSRLAAELSSLAAQRGFATYRGRAVQSASPAAVPAGH